MRPLQVLIGDCRQRLRELPAESVHCCVTSPPYFGLRDYGVAGQMGLEPSPEHFVAGTVGVFREVRRVLRDDGTLWLNIGDSYARNPAKGKTGTPNGPNESKMGYSGGAGVPVGVKEKELIGIPWMLAFALRADGWYLRQEIIWDKINVMPESVRDRCTKSHEQLFLLTKRPRYYFDAKAIREPEVCGRKRGPAEHPDKISTNGNAGLSRRASNGFRNKRSVWQIATKPFGGPHFAAFPPALVEPCVKAGSPIGGVVLDPFFGAGTTALVALALGRRAIGIELNPDYAALAIERVLPKGLERSTALLSVATQQLTEALCARSKS